MRPLGKLLALLVFVSVLGFSPAAWAQGTELVAVLKGGNEVSSLGDAAAGDLNGYGVATVLFSGSGRICFSIVVHGVATPTAAHIHEEQAGFNGPIVIPLIPPDAGSPGAIADCISGLDVSLLNEIRRVPGDFYVNVHTGQFPAGALRGQLQ